MRKLLLFLMLLSSVAFGQLHKSPEGPNRWVIWMPLTQTQIDALSPVEGMAVFNSTDATWQVYQGAAWVNLLSVAGGDITAVIAGTDLTGGAASGSATVSLNDTLTQAFVFTGSSLTYSPIQVKKANGIIGYYPTIASAVTAADSFDVIKLSRGTYYVTSINLQLAKGVHLQGDGQNNTHILNSKNSSGYMFLVGDSVQISDLTIRGTNDTLSVGLISNTGKKGVVLRNVELSKATENTGVCFFSSGGVNTFINCYLDNSNNPYDGSSSVYGFNLSVGTDSSYWYGTTIRGSHYCWGGTYGGYAVFEGCDLISLNDSSGAAINPYGACHVIFRGGSIFSNSYAIASTPADIGSNTIELLGVKDIKAKYGLMAIDDITYPTILNMDGCYAEVSVSDYNISQSFLSLRGRATINIRNSTMNFTGVGIEYGIHTVGNEDSSVVTLDNVSFQNCGINFNGSTYGTLIKGTGVHVVIDSIGSASNNKSIPLNLSNIRGGSFFKQSSFTTYQTYTSVAFNGQNRTVDSTFTFDNCDFYSRMGSNAGIYIFSPITFNGGSIDIGDGYIGTGLSTDTLTFNGTVIKAAGGFEVGTFMLNNCFISNYSGSGTRVYDSPRVGTLYADDLSVTLLQGSVVSAKPTVLDFGAYNQFVGGGGVGSPYLTGSNRNIRFQQLYISDGGLYEYIIYNGLIADTSTTFPPTFIQGIGAQMLAIEFTQEDGIRFLAHTGPASTVDSVVTLSIILSIRPDGSVVADSIYTRALTLYGPLTLQGRLFDTTGTADNYVWEYDAASGNYKMVAQTGGSGHPISDVAYSAAWDGDADSAASRNAIYDKIETIAAGGEVNTASNLGGGLANYDSKSVSDLRFNSFDALDFNLASNLIGIDSVRWATFYANSLKQNIITFGTGVETALGVNTGSAGAPVLFNGAGGTPTSLVGTNISGTAAGLTAGVASAVAVGGITGLGTNVGTWLATPSTANFLAAISDEGIAGTYLNANGTWTTPAGSGDALRADTLTYYATPTQVHDSLGTFPVLDLTGFGGFTKPVLTTNAAGDSIRVAEDSLGAGGSGITTLNTLTAATQTFATGTAGTDFAINSVTSTHTFDIPSSSAANRGLLLAADWTTFNNKQASGSYEVTTNKDATGGYAGLTLYKINFKNAANTFTNFFTNTTTAARTYTFQDRDGTITDDTDLGLKANLASPTFTGTVTIPTPFTLGAVSVLPTGTELNFVDGVTSGIQAQLDGKQAKATRRELAKVAVLDSVSTFDTLMIGYQATTMTIDTVAFFSLGTTSLNIKIDMVDSLGQTAGGTSILNSTAITITARQLVPTSSTWTGGKLLRLVLPTVTTEPKTFSVHIIGHTP